MELLAALAGSAVWPSTIGAEFAELAVDMAEDMWYNAVRWGSGGGLFPLKFPKFSDDVPRLNGGSLGTFSPRRSHDNSGMLRVV